MSDRSFQSSGEALAEFVAGGSKDAFRRIVEAWLPLVMGTALRRTGGQRETAEDIAQMVFMDLARRAKSVTPGKVCG